MKRHIIKPRQNWQKKVEEIGFKYHTLDALYWDESAFYEFTANEVDTIEKATNELWEICLNAVQYLIDNRLYDKFHIPEWFIPHIEDSWNNDAPAITEGLISPLQMAYLSCLNSMRILQHHYLNHL